MEASLRQHPREHVQTNANLPSVALTVGPTEGGGGDLLPHSAQYGATGAPCQQFSAW